MFTHAPSPEEIVQWFKGFTLHDGMEHERYVGGIVAIKNWTPDGDRWMPYINSTSRVAYFWDWCDKNGYLGFIDSTEPELFEVELPNGKSRQWLIEAEITVQQQYIDDGASESHLRTVRTAKARKQVPTTRYMKGKNGGPGFVLADDTAIMKAETGAIARALGIIGMLALPGSGIATAEDMMEYSRTTEDQSTQQEEAPAPKSKAVPNPKQP